MSEHRRAYRRVPKALRLAQSGEADSIVAAAKEFHAQPPFAQTRVARFWVSYLKEIDTTAPHSQHIPFKITVITSLN